MLAFRIRVGTLVPVFLVAYFAWAYLNEQLSTAVTSVLVVLGIAFYLVEAIGNQPEHKRQRPGVVSLFQFVVLLLLLVFGLARAHLTLVEIGFVQNFFDQQSPRFIDYALFYADNFLKGLLLDVMEVFQLSISPITYSFVGDAVDGSSIYVFAVFLFLLRIIPGITVLLAFRSIFRSFSSSSREHK